MHTPLTPRRHSTPQRTYLPGSLVALECEQELLLLLWTFAHHSRAFLAALIASPELADVLMARRHGRTTAGPPVPQPTPMAGRG